MKKNLFQKKSTLSYRSFHISITVSLPGAVQVVMTKIGFMSYKNMFLSAVSNCEYKRHSYPLFIKYNQLKIYDLCKLYTYWFFHVYILYLY